MAFARRDFAISQRAFGSETYARENRYSRARKLGKIREIEKERFSLNFGKRPGNFRIKGGRLRVTLRRDVTCFVWLKSAAFPAVFGR